VEAELSRLTSDLRYAWNSTPSEAAGRFTNFDPVTGTLISTPQPYHTSNKNFPAARRICVGSL